MKPQFENVGSSSVFPRALRRLRNYGREGAETIALNPHQKLCLSSKIIRISLQNSAFAIEIGEHRLHLYPEMTVNDSSDQSPSDLIVIDPDSYFSGMGHFKRIRPSDEIVVRYCDDDRGGRFHSGGHFIEIEHEGNALVLRISTSAPQANISIVSDESAARRLVTRRTRALERVIDIFGGPIEALTPEDGLTLLRTVNDCLTRSPYRPLAADGHPGALVELPERLTPVLIGDLHARVDNLLKILSENAIMEELDRGNAALVFLGDAVHAEDPDASASMDTSVLMMDLIFKLKTAFPDQVFFLLGNHDSFSEEITKGGVPQGRLWEKHIRRVRGEAYYAELQKFYRLSPLVALSNDFVACHAGPPRTRISRELLINARQSPRIAEELFWNRPKTPAFPSGYTRGDVQRFRKSLGLRDDMPFIVAHSPFSTVETVWQDICRIPQHHMVSSALADQVGVFTRIDNNIVPQVYSAEILLPWVNQRASVHC